MSYAFHDPRALQARPFVFPFEPECHKIDLRFAFGRIGKRLQ